MIVQRELAAIALAHRPVSSGPGFTECACGWVGVFHTDHVAESQVPTVHRLIADAEKRAAAAALREVARQMDVAPTTRVPLGETAEKLREMAAALDPSGAVDEAQPCPVCGATGPLHDGDVHDPLGIR